MIDYLELGGTLFVPATHKDLKAIVSGVKYPFLKSVVLDTEDSVGDDGLLNALKNIELILPLLDKKPLHVFIRPRNIKVLKELLSYQNIDKIDGFILPKFGLSNADEYLELLHETSHQIMPSIEGSELFDINKLRSLKEKLLVYKDKIILIRFGLEDMLRQLQMRRTCEDSIFDLSVGNTVLGNFIGIFKSAGFAISGGVYPYFKEDEGFIKDVKRDLKEGLFSKTIIHPRQIDLINELYKVKKAELQEAEEIYNSSLAVFTQSSKMAEKTTMLPYSKQLIQRAKIYGIA